jgi:mRNA interferase RelE/StbE
MGYKAEYRKSAVKYLDGQPRAAQSRIMTAIDNLPSGDVKPLRGRDGYRLVIGSVRVIFNFTDKVSDDGRPIVDIITIGSRGDVYKKP